MFRANLRKIQGLPYSEADLGYFINLVHSKVLLNKVNLCIVLVVDRLRVSKIFCEFDAFGGVFVTRQTYVSTLYKLRYFSAQYFVNCFALKDVFHYKANIHCM